jgi:hypothetical protein
MYMKEWNKEKKSSVCQDFRKLCRHEIFKSTNNKSIKKEKEKKRRGNQD